MAKQLLHTLLDKKFIRFCITGGLNTLVDFGVYTLLTAAAGLNLYLAQCISYSAGILNSYIINRRWTFQTSQRFFSRELAGFLAVNAVILLVSVGLLYLLHNQLGLWHIAAKLATVAVTMVLGFVLNKLLVFRGK